MEAEYIVEGLAAELTAAVKGMAKAKTIEEKLTYSTIIKNLSKSLGVFLDAANEMMDYDLDEDYDS